MTLLDRAASLESGTKKEEQCIGNRDRNSNIYQ